MEGEGERRVGEVGGRGERSVNKKKRFFPLKQAVEETIHTINKGRATEYEGAFCRLDSRKSSEAEYDFSETEFSDSPVRLSRSRNLFLMRIISGKNLLEYKFIPGVYQGCTGFASIL